MIVWVASYPRSGNTFFRLLLNKLYGITNRSVYDHEPTEDTVRINDFIGQQRGSIPVSNLAASDEIHFIKTHEMPGDDSFPAIYLVRDGRDALVSFAHYLLSIRGRPVNSDREAFVNMLQSVIISDLFGGWSPNVIAWLGRSAPTAIVEFDELIKTPTQTIRRALREIGRDGSCPRSSIPSFDELHEFCPWFFRKGRAGAWRSEMTDELQGLFWKHHHAAMGLLQYD